MKKVGIMTLYYRTYNYGAQLQAYALQKAVQKLGYACEQICYKWYDADTENFYANQRGNIERFREFSYSIPHSTRIYAPENIHEAAGEYDTFLCGSDQIWGVPASMPQYIVPHMTLSFVPDDKVKFSYGASMGGAALTTNQIPPIRYWAAKLDAISVREQSAAPGIAVLTGKEVTVVLDPTLLLDAAEWDNLLAPPEADGDYIFTYNIGNDPELEKSAEALAQKLGCTVKTISYSENDTAGPREFLALIKNAKFVLTNSFHGTAFSIIFQKQFYTFPADKVHSGFSKNARAIDLLRTLGLEARFLTRADEADFLAAIDYAGARAALSRAREKSLNFLRESLSIEKKPPMTVIPDKDCCGCAVCGLVCPQGCITFESNPIGFRYPRINEAGCTGCGVCRERCPIARTKQTQINGKKTFAAINRDLEIRSSSSSGGVFSAFAEHIIEQGGVVFGACNDSHFNVVHAFAETMEDAAKFRCSKYVQSDLANTFQEAEDFLKQGRLVLYTGCGCQINALKAYLNHDYDNLFTIDLICIGVTSPLYRRKYIDEYQREFGELVQINERTKQLGFLAPLGKPPVPTAVTAVKTMQGEVVISPQYDIYKKVRYNYFRENCMHCKIRKNNHLSDVSIGDLYGVLAPQFDDGYGISLIIARSTEGMNLLNECKLHLDFHEIEYDEVIKYNTRIETDVLPPLWRNYIQSLDSGSTASKIFYENELCADEFIANILKRNHYIEIKRNSIYVKMLKYQTYGCLLDDEPCLQGRTVIYGAGKIGKLAAECSENKVLCFVDGSGKQKNAAGLPVFQIGSDKLKKLLYAEDEITFAITPVWDFEEIYQNIKLHFPAAHVVSIERVVEKLWE